VLVWPSAGAGAAEVGTPITADSVSCSRLTKDSNAPAVDLKRSCSSAASAARFDDWCSAEGAVAGAAAEGAGA